MCRAEGKHHQWVMKEKKPGESTALSKGNHRKGSREFNKCELLHLQSPQSHIRPGVTSSLETFPRRTYMRDVLEGKDEVPLFLPCSTVLGRLSSTSDKRPRQAAC